MSDSPNAATFSCPYCGTENPPYNFVFARGGSAAMRVAYLTIVCGGYVSIFHPGAEPTTGPCDRILGVSVVECQITPGLVG